MKWHLQPGLQNSCPFKKENYPWKFLSRLKGWNFSNGSEFLGGLHCHLCAFRNRIETNVFINSFSQKEFTQWGNGKRPKWHYYKNGGKHLSVLGKKRNLSDNSREMLILNSKPGIISSLKWISLWSLNFTREICTIFYVPAWGKIISSLQLSQ